MCNWLALGTAPHLPTIKGKLFVPKPHPLLPWVWGTSRCHLLISKATLHFTGPDPAPVASTYQGQTRPARRGGQQVANCKSNPPPRPGLGQDRSEHGAERDPQLMRTISSKLRAGAGARPPGHRLLCFC